MEMLLFLQQMQQQHQQQQLLFQQYQPQQQPALQFPDQHRFHYVDDTVVRAPPSVQGRVLHAPVPAPMPMPADRSGDNPLTRRQPSPRPETGTPQPHTSAARRLVDEVADGVAHVSAQLAATVDRIADPPRQ